MSGIIVTLQHARAARIDGRGTTCAPGIRMWARRYGIDLRAFLRDGLPIEDVEHIDDAFAQRAASIARAEAAHA